MHCDFTADRRGRWATAMWEEQALEVRLVRIGVRCGWYVPVVVKDAAGLWGRGNSKRWETVNQFTLGTDLCEAGCEGPEPRRSIGTAPAARAVSGQDSIPRFQVASTCTCDVAEAV